MRILTLVGEGPAAQVYLAQAMAGRYAAVKVVNAPVRDTDLVLDRIRTCAELCASANSPAPAFHKAGTTVDGRIYVVSDFVTALPLISGSRRALPLKARLRMLATLCESIDNLHAAGMTHGALKPSNLLIEPRGQHPRMVVLDVSSAAALLENAGTTLLECWDVESRRFVAPDRTIRPHEVLPSDDIYAIGKVVALVMQDVSRDTNTRALQEVRLVVDRASEAQPERRYATLREMADHLLAI